MPISWYETFAFKVLVGVTNFLDSLCAVNTPLSGQDPEVGPRTDPVSSQVGIVQNYTVEDWKTDMSYAMEIGIDGFALNNANIDSYTPTQLANAYQAAEEMGFKVFISFDFSYWNNGDTAQITAYMQQYAGHPAQALVSTSFYPYPHMHHASCT